MIKPKLSLVGTDGNAFAILGQAKRAANRAGWKGRDWAKFSTEAQSGDYDHLLQTCMKYFDVE